MPDGVRRSSVAPIAPFAAVLRRGIAAQSPAGRRSPRTVVLTGGPTHLTYVEHSYLATQMGFHLVEGGDLVVRQNRVWLRALDGVEPVDVIYRRVDDEALDPMTGRGAGRGAAAASVPGITWAAEAGGVALANAFGTHVLESPDIAAHLPSMSSVLARRDAAAGEPRRARRAGHRAGVRRRAHRLVGAGARGASGCSWSPRPTASR